MKIPIFIIMIASSFSILSHIPESCTDTHIGEACVIHSNMHQLDEYLEYIDSLNRMDQPFYVNYLREWADHHEGKDVIEPLWQLSFLNHLDKKEIQPYVKHVKEWIIKKDKELTKGSCSFDY